MRCRRGLLVVRFIDLALDFSVPAVRGRFRRVPRVCWKEMVLAENAHPGKVRPSGLGKTRQ